MEKPRVYLETTIPSLLTSRPSNDPVSEEHRSATRKWWDTLAERYDLFVSPLVHSEAAQGDPDAAARTAEVLEGITEVLLTDDVRALSRALLVANALPPKQISDAVHIAACAVYGIDILLTWNCRHIANRTKRGEIEAVCRNNGYEPPVILTPTEALGRD